MTQRDQRRPGPPRFEFPDGELDTGVFLGDVTERSVRVWLRRPRGSVEAVLVVGGEELARSTVTVDAAHDHIGAAVLEAERPCPAEPFIVRVGDVERRHRFAPAAEARTALTFAFGSCHQPFGDPLDGGRLPKHAGARIYPHLTGLLRERGASFALWLGDQVYSDGIAELSVRERMAEDRSITDAELLDTYRHLYRGYFNEAGYRELFEVVPAYLMWDDHDIFDGWGSLMDYTEFDGRIYRAAQTAYREYQHLRNPSGALDAEPPYGYSFWHGDVGFHVPDLRSERDFQRRRVLAELGWAKLDAFFAEAAERDVPTVFLCLSVPLVHGSPTVMRMLERLRSTHGRDVRDRWSVPAFSGQRTMLLERIFAWQSGAPRRQVVVLSGDVHVGAAFAARPRRGAGRFVQWTSSSVSTPTGFGHVWANRLITATVRLGEHELRVWQRGLATANNVGLVRVEPHPDGGHAVSLEVHEYDLRRDRLRLALSDSAAPARELRPG